MAHGKARTEKGGTSLGNEAEAGAVMLLLQHLRLLDLDGVTIAVLAPYKQQVW